jgi:ribose 5-phosphate isomerase B
MTIYFATDHAGFALKEVLLAYVRDELGYAVEDCGAYTYDAEDDYPAYIRVAGESVAKDPAYARAIILGGSGQGEAMVANRFPGVRATVYYGGNEEIITLSREHNDANVLSLGARFVSEDEAKRVVATWLALPFSNEERHTRRLKAF